MESHGIPKLLSLGPSPSSSKKLVAVFGVGGGRRKTVHFGARGYGDYTLYWQTGDTKVARQKRRQYIRRHAVAEDWLDPTAAGTLSRYILWEKPTVRQALTAFKRRFGV